MDTEKVLLAVKAWLTPMLIIAVATFLYDDITELKADVKTLLAQSSADAVKIEYLEMEIKDLKEKVYSSNDKPSNKDENFPNKTELVAILPGKGDSSEYRTVYYTGL